MEENADMQALGDQSLTLLIAQELTVTVHMCKGNCYQRGRVTGFDESSISFRSGGLDKTYQREKISAIVPYKVLDS